MLPKQTKNQVQHRALIYKVNLFSKQGLHDLQLVVRTFTKGHLNSE